MNDIKYSVKFYSYWHCGSGLAAGSDVDALVIKSLKKLPYIPGRTIKGLLKEAVEEILFMENQWDSIPEESNKETNRQMFIRCFGNSLDRDYTQQECIGKKDLSQRGESFFSNAELDKNLAEAICQQRLQKQLYEQLAFTAIDSTGTAKDNSLRQMEVCIPCILKGCILNVPEGFEPYIEKGLKMIKRIGQNRSRGLGRCDIHIEKE